MVLANLLEIVSSQKTLEQVLGQVLNEGLQKGYTKKEIVNSSEFLTGLIAKLFEDETADNMFQIIFANPEQCSACNFIESIIESHNCLQVTIWKSDR